MGVANKVRFDLHIRRKEVWPYFLRYFVPVMLLLMLAFVGYFTVDTRHYEQLARVAENHQVNMGIASLKRDLDGIIPDLRYLSHSEELQDMIAATESKERTRLAEHFATFAEDIQIYDQIRWINKSGMEQMRINFRSGHAHLIANTMLQNKGDRYYFDKIAQLRPGEVYISPLDLNVENGEIEQPYRPMLRVAIQVIDKQGKFSGALVLNYRAERLLNHFARTQHRANSHYYLLNSQGYWLYSSEKRYEWDFMFDGDNTFAKHYPTLWQQIITEEQGQSRSEYGIFTFNTLHAIEYAQTFNGNGYTDHSHMPTVKKDHVGQWIIISIIPQTTLDQEYQERRNNFILAFILLSSFVAMGSWYIATISWQKDQLFTEVELHALVMENATNGIMISDNTPEIIAVNEAFTRITGYTPRDALGQNPNILSSGKHDEHFYQQMWEALDHLGHWEGEVWNRHHDGKIYPEWLSITALRDRRKGQITNFIAIFSDLSERKQAEELLRQRANYDILTGLPNRSLFQDRASHSMLHAKRSGEMMALLYLDLDGFKAINDRLGHDAGDLVLKEVAGRIQSTLREADTVARFGGDEFVVVLEGIKSSENTELVANKIIQAMAVDIIASGEQCNVGISIGISIYPADSDELGELLRMADAALYRVKASGKNNYRLASDIINSGHEIKEEKNSETS